MLRPLTIRVVLAEDNYLVREGVRQLLAAEADIEVIAICEDSDALLAAIETERPDVVLTDIRMPPTGTDEGLRVADQLRDTHPDIGVVVLSQFVESQYAPYCSSDRGSRYSRTRWARSSDSAT